MPVALDQLGCPGPPETAVIDGGRARAYAAATNDPNPAYVTGDVAPPVFGVVPTWSVVGGAMLRVVPPESLMMTVHGEQDMHFHRPLVHGMSLTTTGTPFSVRVGPSGTRVTVKGESVDDAGRPVLTQYMTSFIRGYTDATDAGPDKPAHTFIESARSQPVGQHTVHVDDDQTYRYRDASDDEMPIHLDSELAKSVGLPGIIAHGLCTMAMASQAIVLLGAAGDPARLARLAVRFSANVFPGNDVITTVYDGGKEGDVLVFPFEAQSNGALVLAHGRAEVRP